MGSVQGVCTKSCGEDCCIGCVYKVSAQGVCMRDVCTKRVSTGYVYIGWVCACVRGVSAGVCVCVYVYMIKVFD